MNIQHNLSHNATSMIHLIKKIWNITIHDTIKKIITSGIKSIDIIVVRCNINCSIGSYCRRRIYITPCFITPLLITYINKKILYCITLFKVILFKSKVIKVTENNSTNQKPKGKKKIPEGTGDGYGVGGTGFKVGDDVGTQPPFAWLQSGITRNTKFEVANGCPRCLRWSWVKLYGVYDFTQKLLPADPCWWLK